MRALTHNTWCDIPLGGMRPIRPHPTSLGIALCTSIAHLRFSFSILVFSILVPGNNKPCMCSQARTLACYFLSLVQPTVLNSIFLSLILSFLENSVLQNRIQSSGLDFGLIFVIPICILQYSFFNFTSHKNFNSTFILAKRHFEAFFDFCL